MRPRNVLTLVFVISQIVMFALLCGGGSTGVAAPYQPVYGYSHYLPWYDDVYGNTWLLMSQTSAASGGQNEWYDIYLKNQSTGLMDLMNPGGSLQVDQGSTTFQRYVGKFGGPVQIDSQASYGLVSERSLFGNSFEEVWASANWELDHEYWWPAYMSVSGMQNWIMIANPPDSTETVRVRIIMHDGMPGPINETYTLTPGQSLTPSFPGYIGGPVQVKAWRNGGSEYNPSDERNIIASERVLFNGSFNEMPGIPSWKLTSFDMWTWYDNVSPGAANAILVSNPNSYPIFVVTIIGNPSNPVAAVGGDLPAYSTGLAVEDVIGGPVFVIGMASQNDSSPRNVVASQQIFWGPSFGEIAGSTSWDFGISSNFTWYDMVSPGAVNYVMLTNPSNNPLYFEVKIAGQSVWNGSLGGYASDNGFFPGFRTGPVEVQAWQDAGHTVMVPVLASQRVLWNGYFNEIVGKGL